MTKCRGCNKEAVVGRLCNTCNEGWQIAQCAAEIKGCIKFIREHPVQVSAHHITDLVVLRGQLTEIIKVFADRKKG